MMTNGLHTLFDMLTPTVSLLMALLMAVVLFLRGVIWALVVLFLEIVVCAIDWMRQRCWSRS